MGERLLRSERFRLIDNVVHQFLPVAVDLLLKNLQIGPIDIGQSLAIGQLLVADRYADKPQDTDRGNHDHEEKQQHGPELTGSARA